MTKIVEVGSIDAKVFMETLFQMFEAGAKYKGGMAVKRPLLVAQLEMDMAGVVPQSANVRVLPQEQKKEGKLEVKMPTAKAPQKPSEPVVEQKKEEPKAKEEEKAPAKAHARKQAKKK